MRYFTIRTRNGMETFASTLSDFQAAELVRDHQNEFPRNLSYQFRSGGRPLSDAQMAWMHWYAVQIHATLPLDDAPPAPVPAPVPAVQAVQAVQAPESAGAYDREVKATVSFTAAGGLNVSARNVNEGSEIGAVRRSEAFKEWISGDVAMLQYYIPERLESELPNPARLLKGAGFFWSDDSNYIGSEKSFARPEIKAILEEWAEIRDRDATYNGPGRKFSFRVVRYHPEDLKEVRAMAVASLEDAMKSAHESLIRNIDAATERWRKAQEALNASAGEKERSALDQERDNRIRGILREAGDALNASITCAEMFDETMRVSDLIEGLRQAIRSQTLAFNVRMREVGRKPAPMV